MATTVKLFQIKDIATDRLLGRDTAGNGSTEELTVGGGIEFTGSGGIQTSALTGDVTKIAGGTTTTLATVNSNVGTFGSATQVPVFTVNAKGLITAVTNTTITAGDIINGGNTTGADITIGTNDAFGLNLETNNVSRLNITGGASTGGAVTITDVTSNTNTVENVLTLVANSSGTAANGFGAAIMFKAETSTTNSIDVAGIKASWTNATHGNRTSKLSFFAEGSAGGQLEYVNINSGAGTGAVTIGTSNPLSIERDNFTPATNYTIGNAAVTMTLSSTAETAGSLSLSAGTATNATSVGSIRLGASAAFTQTSGTRNIINVPTSFSPTSGTAVHNQLSFDGTFNQTGGANGIIRTINIANVVTAVADYRAIEISANGANMKGVYQTGATATNNFVGKTSFGATTVPTALLMLAAGTATANTAPIKLTTGTALTTPEDGAIEYHSSHLYFTIGSTRYQLDQQAGSGTVTATGGSLTVNAVVLGAGTTDTKVSTGITTNGGSELNLGVNATTIGKVKMFGNTSGDVTVQPAAVAGTATVQTLPATTGTLVNRVTTSAGVSASNSDGALTFTLGAITPSTVNGHTFTTGSSTFTGTAAQTYTFPTTTATLARTDAAQTFTGIQTFSTPIAATSVATMSATVGGGVPTPPNNTTTFLRGDGTFAAPTSSTSLSAITAASASNSIDNLNNSQTWTWSTATSSTPFTFVYSGLTTGIGTIINGNALTTGTLNQIATTNNSVNSTNGLLYVNNGGSSTSGNVFKVSANGNSTGPGFIVKANGKNGFGTTAPQSDLTVAQQAAIAAPASGTILHVSAVDAASNGNIQLDVHNANAPGPVFFGRHARGTTASPTATQTGDVLAQYGGAGYGTSAYSAILGNIEIKATQNFTNTAQGTSMSFKTTANGSTSTVERVLIDNSGVVTISDLGAATIAGAVNSSATGLLTNSKVFITPTAAASFITIASGSILTTAANFTTSGANALTLTTTEVTNVTLPTTGTLSAIAGTETLTNKRINPRVISAANYTTDTGTSLDVSTCDLFIITAQAGNLLFNNPSGTPLNGQRLTIRIKDNGTLRTLTWGSEYRAMGVGIPGATVAGKIMYIGLIFDDDANKWDIVSVSNEP